MLPQIISFPAIMALLSGHNTTDQLDLRPHDHQGVCAMIPNQPVGEAFGNNAVLDYGKIVKIDNQDYIERSILVEQSRLDRIELNTLASDAEGNNYQLEPTAVTLLDDQHTSELRQIEKRAYNLVMNEPSKWTYTNDDSGFRYNGSEVLQHVRTHYYNLYRTIQGASINLLNYVDHIFWTNNGENFDLMEIESSPRFQLQYQIQSLSNMADQRKITLDQSTSKMVQPSSLSKKIPLAFIRGSNGNTSFFQLPKDYKNEFWCKLGGITENFNYTLPFNTLRDRTAEDHRNFLMNELTYRPSGNIDSLMLAPVHHEFEDVNVVHIDPTVQLLVATSSRNHRYKSEFRIHSKIVRKYNRNGALNNFECRIKDQTAFCTVTNLRSSGMTRMQLYFTDSCEPIWTQDLFFEEEGDNFEVPLKTYRQEYRLCTPEGNCLALMNPRNFSSQIDFIEPIKSSATQTNTTFFLSIIIACFLF